MRMALLIKRLKVKQNSIIYFYDDDDGLQQDTMKQVYHRYPSSHKAGRIVLMAYNSISDHHHHLFQRLR